MHPKANVGSKERSPERAFQNLSVFNRQSDERCGNHHQDHGYKISRKQPKGATLVELPHATLTAQNGHKEAADYEEHVDS